MQIRILYEDENILAIDKPSGVIVHSDGKSKEETISDYFVNKYPEIENVGESFFVNNQEIKKPGIVHRLDRETSGVLLLVKNQKSFLFFKDLFKKRKIKKTYQAIVSGYVKKDKGKIDKMIGRSPRDFRRRLAGRGARGKLREAVTEYKVLKRFEDKKGNKFSFLEIRPKTGRTHQIRVHLKFLNYPVVCDSLYNPKGICPKTLNRMALHASFIEFIDQKGKEIKIESPLPKEFTNFI